GDRRRSGARGRGRRTTGAGRDRRRPARRRGRTRRDGRRGRARARLLRDRPRPDRTRRPLRARRVRRGRALSAISVRGLRKSYGSAEAVRGIDFEIQAGEVFGLLGPNGAGKTTTIEILEGYRDRSGGDVEVLGVDPQHAGRARPEQVGV